MQEILGRPRFDGKTACGIFFFWLFCLALASSAVSDAYTAAGVTDFLIAVALLLSPCVNASYRGRLGLSGLVLLVSGALSFAAGQLFAGCITPGLTYAGGGTASFILSACILAPVCEELVMRAVVFPAFLRYVSPVPALLLQAFVFSMAHASAMQMPLAFLVGCAAGAAYLVSGLPAAVLIHMGANLGAACLDGMSMPSGRGAFAAALMLAGMSLLGDILLVKNQNT